MEGKTKKERGEYPWAPKDALPSARPNLPLPVEGPGEEPAVEEKEAPAEKPVVKKKKKIRRK